MDFERVTMRTFILAAGQGTRLRPLTDEKPKCLVELGGKSLLQRQIEALRAAGINDIHLIGGYRHEQLAAFGLPVHPNPRFAETNMVASLFCAEHAMDRELLISYGDIVFEADVVAKMKTGEGDLSVAVDLEWRRLWELRMEDPLSDAESLKMDPHGRLLELGKQPSSYEDVEAQYLGLIKVCGQRVEDFKRAYHDLDPEGSYDGRSRDQMYMTSFIQHLIDNSWNVQSVQVENGWLEVDTVEELTRYEELLKDKEQTFYRT